MFSGRGGYHHMHHAIGHVVGTTPLDIPTPDIITLPFHPGHSQPLLVSDIWRSSLAKYPPQPVLISSGAEESGTHPTGMHSC